MERMPKSLLLILGLCCFAFTSCVDSENPLSDPKQATVDSSLLGVWRVREKEGDVEYYHIGKAGDKFPAGMLRVKCIKHKNNGELPRGDNEELLVFTSTIGKNHYLNISGLDAEKIKKTNDSQWEPSMADGYFIYKYEISGDKMIVACMDSDKKKEAIKAAKLTGTIEDHSTRFNDTTENLARFFATPDAEKLFYTKDNLDDGYGILERVK
jgi:hypothetical protein